MIRKIHRDLFNVALSPVSIALFFGGAVLLRGLVLLALAGANWTSDSQSFVLFGRLLRDFSVSMPLYLRSSPYLLINAITLSDLYLTPILIFHAVLAGLAAGFLVYAVATSSRFVAVLTGVVLLCDMVWATSQRIILIEGPLASFQLIAIALIVLHYGKSPKSVAILFWSGVLYGWCLLFRQSNLPLLLPILLFYAYRLRSLRHVAAVGFGMLALLMTMAGVNHIRTGDERLWAQGGWYAEFPMFDLGMFSGRNGPASQRIAEDIVSCGITEEPDKLRFLAKDGSNVTQWTFEACILRQEAARIEGSGGPSIGDARALSFSKKCNGESGASIVVDSYYENWYRQIKCAYAEKDWAFEDQVASLIATAYYKEALPKNLHRVPRVMWGEVPRFLAGSTYTLPSQLWLFPLWSRETPDYICPFDWCTRQNFPSTYPFDSTSILEAQRLAKWSTQLYLALSDRIFLEKNTDGRTFGIFALMSLITLMAPTGILRIMGMLVIIPIFYNASITALVNVYILRYTSAMSSLYAIHGGLAVCSMILLMRSFFLRGRLLNKVCDGVPGGAESVSILNLKQGDCMSNHRSAVAHRSRSDSHMKIGEDTYSSAMASAHRYMDWMLSPFKPYLRGDIVEIGIGHGSYYDALAPFGGYLGIDIDERSVNSAQGRFPDGKFARADVLHAGFLDNLLPAKADSIVSINVLEHISDDAMAVKNLVDALKPGGRLMISVPAMMGLYNDLDRLAGHHRRYNLDDFRHILSGLPVEVEKLCYFNPIGGLGWWANRFRRHTSLNSDAINGQIEIFEKYILPVSRVLDPLTQRFFGQSLVCIARRT